MKKVSVASIKENVLIAPDIYRMELELTEDANAIPGQFVNPAYTLRTGRTFCPGP